MNSNDEIGFDGLQPGRDYPTCGQPLEPGHLDDTIALVWLCPSHGPVDFTPRPVRGT